MALWSIGPRQITGVSSGTKNPMEITFTPCASSGRIMSLNPTGLPVTPSMRGTLKPQTSASRTPTLCPSAASATARFTVTLDLPTPPLPEATAMIDGLRRERDLRRRGRAAAVAPPRSCCTSASRCSGVIGVSRTSTRSTPSSGCTAAGDVLRDAVLQRTALDRDQDVDPDDVAVDLDVLQHPDVLDGPADLGVHDAPQRFADLFLRDHGLPPGLLSAMPVADTLG